MSAAERAARLGTSTGGDGRGFEELAQLLERLRVHDGAPAGGASTPDAGPGPG